MKSKKSSRVVVLIDANDGEVIEAPEGIEVVFIPWDKIANNPETPEDLVRELDLALVVGEIDKAVAIMRSLTAQPPDDGYDEDPRIVGYPS